VGASSDDGLGKFSEGRFPALIEAAADGIFISTDTGRYVEVNASGHRLLGYEPGELVGKTIADVFSPAERAELADALARVMAGEVLTQEWTFSKKDGTPFHAEVTAQRLGTGLLMTFVRDAGRRKAFERQIRESEARLRSILETAPDVIMQVDRAGTILFLNRTTPPFRPEQVLGSNCFDYVLPEARPRVEAALEKVFTTREIDEYEILGPPVRESGVREWSSVRAGPHIEGDRVVAATLCATNVTRRKESEELKAKLEDQLRQSQKVEGIGRLAGGVAHDFNNLLTSILGFTELARNSVPKGSEAAEFLEGAIESAKRGAVLTQQLLAFARKKIVRPEVVVLNEVLEGMASMIRRLLGGDMEVVLHLAPGLGSVRVDTGSIEQVIMNLSLNARDAMAGKGSITLETKNVSLDLADCRDHPEIGPGEYVFLGVTDAGTGMSPEVAARIFDPFFTTKPVGEGTGLGLATCEGIVRQAGGSISVRTRPGEGSTFVVYLPRVHDAPTARATKPSPRVSTGGSETLLVVEDEQLILVVMKQALTALGYKVIPAADGAEALAIVAATAGPIDLLITDVVMPAMGGRELARRVSALRPGIRVLYSSGYTADAIVARGVLEEGIDFLQKPYVPAVLAARVREMLDR
jgi:two-component system cell cycle sensor histidine kinase/response regulator CckA